MADARAHPDPTRSILAVHAVTLEWERIRVKLAAEHHVSPVDITALLELRRRRTVRAGALATSINLSPSGISALLDRLVNAGLAERAADDEDRRSVTVHLTANGNTVANEVLANPALTRLTDALRGAGPTTFRS